MNPETKSADALARELALEIGKEIRDAGTWCVPARIAEVILTQTKLRELCAVAEAARNVDVLMDTRQDREAYETLRQALAALDGGAK